MILIEPHQKYVTVISTFTFEESNEDKVINLLTLAIQKAIKHVPGYKSSALHRSVDGKKVFIYAIWESIESYQKMHNNPTVIGYLAPVHKIAKLEPSICEVLEVFDRD
jgi:quinol monooxygenase YgiN